VNHFSAQKMGDCGFWDQPFQEETTDYFQDSGLNEDFDLFSSAFGPPAHFFTESLSDSLVLDWLIPSEPKAEESIKGKKCELCRKCEPATSSFGCPVSTSLHHAHADCMMAKSKESTGDCLFPHETRGPFTIFF
jgi:hypothetical protein